MRNLKIFTLCSLVYLLLSTGCASLDQVKPLPRAVIKYKIPTIAVLAFENKANFPYRWDLGEGVRDQLVNELVNSRRYTVLNRADLKTIISELEMQKQSHFRKEGRAGHGRLKNVQYLIKGAVTDFSHVSGGGIRGLVDKIGLGAGGEMAVVSLTMYVIKVETGEVVVSRSFEGRAWAGRMDFSGTYSKVSFGGSAFYRTPLGEATREVIQDCIKSISEVIVRESWYPSVVRVEGDALVISGGIDRGMKVDSIWSAYEPGEPLVDPATGDQLGRLPGKTSGEIKVTEVEGTFSHATILEGYFNSGQTLRPVEEKPASDSKKADQL